MGISEYISEERIILDLKSNTKKEIIEELCTKLLDNSNSIDEENYSKLVLEVLERENLSSTGMQEGIAIPHVKSSYVNKMSVVMAISKEGREFASLDGKKSKLFFLLVSPKDNNRLFMRTLSKFAQLSMEEDKIEEILKTEDKKEIIRIISSLED